MSQPSNMTAASPLVRILASYHRYHRDPRNRLTHYFGVPIIVFSLLVFLQMHAIRLGGEDTPLGWIVLALLAAGYLALDLRIGLATVAVLAALAAVAGAPLVQGAAHPVGFGVALFVCGWILQLWGHRLEGNRPALLDNLLQILVAPFYLVAEAAFTLGLRRRLAQAVGAAT